MGRINGGVCDFRKKEVVRISGQMGVKMMGWSKHAKIGVLSLNLQKHSTLDIENATQSSRTHHSALHRSCGPVSPAPSISRLVHPHLHSKLHRCQDLHLHLWHRCQRWLSSNPHAMWLTLPALLLLMHPTVPLAKRYVLLRIRESLKYAN